MEIFLKSIHILNFRGTSDTEVTFGKRTYIKGRNKAGKSTVINAFTWVMFDKDMNGDSCNDIRPHDENGEPVNHIDVAVTVVLSVDGKEHSFTKKQVQKWKNDVLIGNDNLYFINDIPKKLKEFDDYINKNIFDKETFISCLCSYSFFRLDSKKRRQKLLDLVGDVSNEDVLNATTGEYAEIESILSDGSVDELIKRQNDKIKGFEREKMDIPARIDELNKGKVDIDLAELDKEREEVEKKIDEINTKKSVENPLLDELKKLEEQAGEIHKNIYLAYSTRKQELTYQIRKAEFELELKTSENNSKDKRLIELKDLLDKTNAKGNELNDTYSSVKAAAFDEKPYMFDEEKDTKCAYCGSVYPADKIEEIKGNIKKNRDSAFEKFNSDKKKSLDALKEQAVVLKQKVAEIKEEILALENKKGNDLESARKEIEKYNNELLELGTCPDYNANEEYSAICNRILMVKQEIENQKQNAISSSEEEQLYTLKNVLATNIKKRALLENNNSIDERIAELNQRLRNLSQLSANEERIRDMLKDFNKYKMEMLTDRVNKFFKICKFVLFEKNISNDDYKNICDIKVGGTNYEISLNGGDKKLADIDLLAGFQKMNNIIAPVIVDEASVIDSDRIPVIDNQIIILNRSDDKALTVECEG